MKRQIKFRFWNNAGDSSKMFYDTEQVMECLKQQTLSNDTNHKYHSLGFDHENCGSVFMQFTGLIDKNGKEIYEGDIVKDQDKNIIISFESGSFGYRVKSPDMFMSFCYCYTQYSNLEVIGNIHENPELL